MQEHVSLANNGEHIGGLSALHLAELTRCLRDELPLFEIVAVEADDRPETCHIERAGKTKDLRLTDVQFAHQQFQDARIDSFFDFETNRRPEPAPYQFALQCLQEILGVIFLDFEVLVTGDAERVMFADLHSRKEFVEVGGNDVFQRHVALIADFDEARKKWWNFNSREEFGSRRGISNHDGEIQ